MIPFELVIWDAAECAAYLRQERSSFLKRTQFRDGFPRRLDLPGHPRWLAIEVTAYAANSRQNHEKAA